MGVQFTKYPQMDYGQFLQGVVRDEIESVEMWRDKEPYFWPPWRTYFEGQRAVVKMRDTGVCSQ